MNRSWLTASQIYFTGATAGGIAQHSITFLNEGVGGYFMLGLIGLSAVMFIRETLAFHKFVLSYEGEGDYSFLARKLIQLANFIKKTLQSLSTNDKLAFGGGE